MDESIKIYKEGVSKNIKDISEILTDCGVDVSSMLPIYEKTLSLSSNNILEKWKSGRKYLRTHFVKKAFSNFYPEEHLEISLFIDAMVNLMDDLFDEELTEQEKGLYIMELVRVFSLFNYSLPNKKIQLATGKYLNELIVLAVAENIYEKMIKEEKNLDNVINHSISLLLCRAMDINIFNEIALIDYDGDIDALKKIGQIFRAINIFEKDIKDIEHDKENNSESAVIIVIEREDIDFSEYKEKMLTILVEKAKKIAEEAENKDEVIKEGILGFEKMIDETSAKIKSN